LAGVNWWRMECLEFGFERLVVWQQARKFKLEIRDLTKTFPLDEKYKLTTQLIKSSRSINALISEGHGRFTYADQIHYCVQSRGSLYETINHLIDAFDEGYITEEKLNYFRSKGRELEKYLNGYINYLSVIASTSSDS
jgi:four helix bundle protein